MNTHIPSQLEFNIPNILIVDDMESNIIVFEETLSNSNMNLISALCVDDAMHILRENDISLVCIDIQMPKKDGFDLVKEMKADEKTKDVPFVIVTGMEYDYSNVLRSFELGALDYIVKPIGNALSKGKLNALIELFRRIGDERDVIKEIKKLTSHLTKEDLNPVVSSSLSIIQKYIDDNRI